MCFSFTVGCLQCMLHFSRFSKIWEKLAISVKQKISTKHILTVMKYISITLKFVQRKQYFVQYEYVLQTKQKYIYTQSKAKLKRQKDNGLVKVWKGSKILKKNWKLTKINGKQRITYIKIFKEISSFSFKTCRVIAHPRSPEDDCLWTAEKGQSKLQIE